MAAHNLVLSDERRQTANSEAGTAAQHTMRTSLALHILPGVAMLAFVALVAPLLRSRGLPPIFAGHLSILCVLVPLELGYLVHLGWKRNGRLSLRGVVRYSASIPWWQYLVLAPLLVIWFLITMSWWRQAAAAIGLLTWLPPWLLDPVPLAAAGPYPAGGSRTARTGSPGARVRSRAR